MIATEVKVGDFTARVLRHPANTELRYPEQAELWVFSPNGHALTVEINQRHGATVTTAAYGQPEHRPALTFADPNGAEFPDLVRNVADAMKAAAEALYASIGDSKAKRTLDSEVWTVPVADRTPCDTCLRRGDEWSPECEANK